MAQNTSALALIALFVVVFPCMVLATQYIVGDDQGWTSDVDYYSWMDGKTFHVGDSLGAFLNFLHSSYIYTSLAIYVVRGFCAFFFAALNHSLG